MFLSTEKYQILEPLESPVIVNCDENSASLDLPQICTDVNVVPEQKKAELEQLISNLEEEIVGLKLKKKSLHEKQREALNRILDLKGSIRVFCRIRPFLPNERRRTQEPILVHLEKIAVQSAGNRKEFEFDKVFSQTSTQEDVFVEVEPILRSALDGHNVCVLAFGQTGTGKTFTMEGTSEQPGIVPRALKQIFHQASLDNSNTITFSMSMLEVYMGNLKDLLAPRPPRRAFQPVSRCSTLNIQTDQKGKVEIEGLIEVPVADLSKAVWWYTKGRRVRSTSCTNVNDMSSRSHCLTRIIISRHGDTMDGLERQSKLWMVDLGGSERLLKTGATGQRLDEGRSINLSLSALGDVISALRRKKCHVPYRNSKLTQILRDSLGEGSKVLMLVHVNPSEEDVGETLCSLSFAKRARAIESTPDLPEDINKRREKKIAEIQEGMKEAEEEYHKTRNQLHKAEFLLSENKKIYLVKYCHVEDEAPTTRDDTDDLKEVQVLTQTSEKAKKRNPLPHFMTSTAASRCRQSAASRETDFRTRVSRSVARSSIQLSCSQSMNHLDPRLRAVLRNSMSKPHEGVKTGVTEDLKLRSKTVTSSNPNLKTTLARHRRRMSDLI